MSSAVFVQTNGFGSLLDVQHRRHVGLDGAQELQELGAAVAPVHLSDDLPIGAAFTGTLRRVMYASLARLCAVALQSVEAGLRPHAAVGG